MLKTSEKSIATASSFCSVERHRYFALSAFILLVLSGSSWADKGFNPAFLEHLGSGSDVTDLSAFANDDSQMPGKYIVDIYVNGEPADHREVEFIADKNEAYGDTGLMPCLTLEQLKKYGVKTEAAEAFIKKKPSSNNENKSEAKENATTAHPETCSRFIQSIPLARAIFDFEQQRLDLSIPQALISASARGYVDPALWDDGINAGIMDYNFTGANATNTGSSGGKDDSYYLNLRTGLNFGSWRLRNYSTWNDNNGMREWQNVNTYVQRSIIPLKSALTLGDSYSSDDVFDSTQFRGLQLASDDDMLPDSEKDFAPVIRGIAKTNAQVSVSQNGYVIYQSYVTPGAFEITDLYPSSGSGDLTVTVKEEDGSEQKFIQPYASVPILQREGHTKYSLTAGQYRNGYGSDKPEFGQFTLVEGFGKGITLYGGAQGSENYEAAALGMGKNLGEIGAVSIDVTQAKTNLPDGVISKGQSYRFLYAKSFAESGTDFRLLGYRYSTSGFYSLDEAIELNDDETQNSQFDIGSHKRSRMEGSVNQTLGEGLGSFYFSASVQNYWDENGTQEMLQWGYSNTWNSISFNLAYSDNHTTGEDHDKQMSLNVSVPLDRFLKSSWATYSVNHDSNGRVNQQAGISGTLLADRNLNYNVSEGYGNQGQSESGNANLNYQGRYGNSNLGYSHGNDTRRVNYGLQGGVVAHSGGVTLSQPLGETIALVAVPGADDTKITNNSGVVTDHRGYAVVPYISPYRRNKIGLDTTSLGDNVEVEESAKDVIPTRGAVVRAKFNAHVGYRVMMTLARSNGKAVPFGATVAPVGADEKDSSGAAIVGEQGQTYLSGLAEKGQLIAQWGKAPEQQCKVSYQLSQQDMQGGMPSLKGICQSL